MTEAKNINKREKYYIYFACLSLIMYIFGHSTEFGTLPFPDKLFYIPCAISLAIAFVCPNYWNWKKEDKYFTYFLIFTVINSSLQDDPRWQHIYSCILGFLIFRYIRDVDYKKCLTILFYATPFVVAIHYLYSNPFLGLAGFRYGGFQGDPNCFAMAMNVLVYSSGYVLNNDPRKYAKIVSIGNLVGLIALIMATQSRAGLVIAGILLLVNIWNMITGSKGLTFFVACLGLVAMLFVGNRFNETFERSFSRFGNDATEGDVASANHRFEEIPESYNLLINNPLYMPFGIGFSQTEFAKGKFEGYIHNGRSHNTYCAVLMEEGVVGFLLFIAMLVRIGKKAYFKRRTANGNAKLALYTCMVFFIFTIFSLPFLPFWFSIYLANNEN